MTASSESRPVVASYCATFLKPEMLHIYRQIAGLQRVRPVVLAQKRENADRFPFEPVYVVGKPATHFLRRFWFRQLMDQPWQISRMEFEALHRLLERSGARLFHIYFGHIAVHLLPLIIAWPKPTVVSFHGADVLVDMNKPAYRRATEEMLACVKKVLVRSESLRRAILNLGCAPEKIEIQRTGIPLEQFPFLPRGIPQEGDWKLLQAGRLVEKKGLPTTLRAFAAFLKEFPNSQLTIAGEGPMLNELQALAAQSGIARRVSFTGMLTQEKLRDLFYQSHLFLHPSQTGSDGNQEGVPNSMLEAMASGLPVFATRHGGIPEAVEEGVSGLLVAERDHQALGRALLETVKNPEKLARIAQAGSGAVVRNFDLQAQVRRLEDIYLQTIGG